MSTSAPGSGPGSRPARSIPRSRAYWELKAEQMLNRVFDPVQPIDLDVDQAPDPHQLTGSTTAALQGSDPQLMPSVGLQGIAADTTAPAGSAPPGSAVAAPTPRWRRPRSRIVIPTASHAAGSRLRRPNERLLLIGTLCGVCLASVVGSLLYFGHWTRLQQSISQERNLLLLERLRSLGPANPTPVPAAPILPDPAAQGVAGTEGLPPPPPQEPWIEQLSTLPSATSTPPRVLTVPVSPRLGASTSPPSRTPPRTSARAAGPLPQLVGVVAGAGRATSAIFLVGGSSMSVASGEQIGSTGWRLRSAEGETALLERGGELRQISIASGNGP